MKNKKVLMAALGVVLVAVIAAGVWFLSGDRPGNSTPDSAGTPEPPADGGGSADIDWLHTENVLYRLVNKTEQEGGEHGGFWASSARFVDYQGQPCQFSADDAGIYLVSPRDGSVLKSYDRSYFKSSYGNPLALDAEGQLWELEEDWDSRMVSLCLREEGQDQTPELLDMTDASGRCLLNLDDYSLSAFAIWGDYVVVCCYSRETWKGALLILNRTEKTAKVLPLNKVSDFCIDGEGTLYALSDAAEGRSCLTKYSLEEDKVLWQNKELSYSVDSLWYLDGKLFVMGGYPDMRLFTVDVETGERGADILNLWTGTDIYVDLQSYDMDRLTDMAFGLDSSGLLSVCIIMATEDHQDCIRTTWTLEPYVASVDPEDVVTLTITSPYPVDSIAGAVQMYQQQHPEVQVVWDTQYISRDEFRPNILEYKDQIAVRTIAGDVGDIQMITGAGLSQDVITGTDAFTDLTPYLDACPFLDELELNLLDPLRDADGAVRALPLGIQPQYLIYNMTLLEEQGNPVDPDTVTWSELLNLALRWKEEGTDLSLTTCAPGGLDTARATILTWLLLANLYDAQKEDGSVQLDQPYLRELLAKLKELWNSPQLVRTDGHHVSDGFFQRALFISFFSDRSTSDRISDGIGFPGREGVDVQAAPIPWGEVWHKQQGYAFCWGIPASSQQKDAAWDLLQFIISSRGLPGYSYSRDTELLNDAAQELWYEQYQENHRGMELGDFFQQTQALRKQPIGRYDEPYGWNQAVFQPVLKYMSDELTLDEALEEANANWERFLLE